MPRRTMSMKRNLVSPAEAEPLASSRRQRVEDVDDVEDAPRIRHDEQVLPPSVSSFDFVVHLEYNRLPTLCHRPTGHY